MKVPIIRYGDVLLSSFQENFTDRDVADLQTDLLHEVTEIGAAGVLLDVGGVEALDTYQAKMISDLAAMTRVLGCEVVLCGIRPNVALTLVELHAELAGVRKALSIPLGMAQLRRGSLVAGGPSTSGV